MAGRICRVKKSGKFLVTVRMFPHLYPLYNKKAKMVVI